MLQTTLTCSLYDAPSTGDSGLLQALDRWSKALTHWAKAWKKALRAHQRHLETRCECEIYLPYYKMKCFPPHILGKYKLWLGAPLQWVLFLERWVPSTPAYRTWGPETILRFDTNSALSHYMRPTNPQVPCTMAPDLYFPVAPPWGDDLMTQHTGKRTKSLWVLRQVLRLLSPGYTSVPFWQEEGRMGGGWIQSNIHCKDNNHFNIWKRGCYY